MRKSLTAGAVGGALVLAFLMTGCAPAAAPPAGTWGSSAEGEPQLVLQANGSLSGTDGCNRLTGTWSKKGKTVSFDDVASTRMACTGVDTWLIDLSTATIAGTTMHVLNDAGTEIGTIERG
jgi:heat shock protein HslJ